MVNGRKSIWILGSRGIPARYGGFETFAEHIALFLAGRGWDVRVFCQLTGGGDIAEEVWRGIRLVKIPIRQEGPLGTILFDLLATARVLRDPALVLNLGYNTACFGVALRLAGIRNIINMDGIEWQRSKWSKPVRAWFWLNERLACGLSHHLIADHPEIANHLATRTRRDKISCIPYGGETVDRADTSSLSLPGGLTSDGYALVVARAAPENSILEIVRAFSRRPRSVRLVVLGDYGARVPYHRAVREAADPQVCFLGPIYEGEILRALRAHARLYVHGHRVGGTNPSLVEALGAGSPVLAHDNRFNRWVAGPDMMYFRDVDECAAAFDRLLPDAPALSRMRASAHRQQELLFVWDRVLEAYEALLAEAAADGCVPSDRSSWEPASAGPEPMTQLAAEL
jgi:glycosyltransferase involved in cell wall biosynthesis